MGNVMFISTGDAVEIAGVSRPTIINWCREFKIGTLVAGRWRVDKDKLEAVLRGEVHYDRDEK